MDQFPIIGQKMQAVLSLFILYFTNILLGSKLKMIRKGKGKKRKRK